MMLGRALPLMLALANLPTACSRDQGDALVTNEQRAVMDWATGAGATVLSEVHRARVGTTMTAIDELSIPLPWPEYTERLRATGPAGYRLTTSDASHIGFARSTAGDAYSLTIESLAPGPPVRGRITFVARPD